MTDDTPRTHADRLDRATAARLRKLADAPVDTADLEARLDDAMAERAVPAHPRSRRVGFRRLVGLAAGLAVAVLVLTSLLQQTGSPAQAATLDLTEVHRRLIDDATADAHATNLAQVNAMIAARGRLSASQLHTHVRSCCLRNVQGTLRAAVLLEQDGQRMSIVVADGENFAAPMGRTVTVDGTDFHIHEMGGLTMVMARSHHRWLCVMADVDAEALLAVAAGIQF